ncbi:MAG TPA: hypothetical protein DEF45_06760, partial [Rhodopirellula sp.]|nr:hypothetical protein [Rhodopirellula sp.]
HDKPAARAHNAIFFQFFSSKGTKHSLVGSHGNKEIQWREKNLKSPPNVPSRSWREKVEFTAPFKKSSAFGTYLEICAQTIIDTPVNTNAGHVPLSKQRGQPRDKKAGEENRITAPSYPKRLSLRFPNAHL